MKYYISKHQNPFGRILKNEEAASIPNYYSNEKQDAEADLSFMSLLKTLPRRASQKIIQAYNNITGSNVGELGHKLKLDGPGTDVVSLDKNVIRVTPYTEQRGTLFNEFVEAGDNPTIRTASEYKNLNSNAVVGDRRMLVKNFNLFAGIENGHWKMDKLENFNDATTVIPVRNIKSNIDPIQELIYGKDNNEYDEKLLKELNEEYYKILFSKPWRKPFYSTFSNGTGDDPRVVPNDGSKLTEAQIENIGKRLFLHDSALTLQDMLNHGQTFSTDSLQYYYDQAVLPEYINNSELTTDMINEYIEREKKRIDTVLSQHNNNKLSLNDYTKPLTKEEQELYNSIKSTEPVKLNYYYGDIFGFSPESIKIHSNLFGVLNDYFHSTGVHNKFNERFLKVYDKKLYDYKKKVHNANLQLLPKINELHNKKDNNIKVVTSQNDTIPVSDYAASIKDKKMILGNPNGGLFVADFNNLSQEQLDSIINPYLKANPSYLFMPDMGSYSMYGLQNGIDPKLNTKASIVFGGYDNSKKPTYNDYWLQFTEDESKAPYDPQKHYLVGVKKSGGVINYLNLFK